MTPPVIGITTGRTTSRNGYPVLVIVEAYVNALTRTGASPVLIPLGLPEPALANLLTRLDGVLFSGGGDMQPGYYGNQDHPLVSGVDPDRDRVEFFLFQETLRTSLPFLGVCRGLQLINVALGGTLYEDILDQRPGALKHQYFPAFPRDFLPHPVSITPDSRLSGILGSTQAEVNSLHHQGICQLGTGLQPTAFAPDGLVEAIELPDYPFGVAVQWHPEWLPPQASMDELFRAFILASQDFRRSRS